MGERFEGVYNSLVDAKNHPMKEDEFKEFLRHVKNEIISKCCRCGNFDYEEDVFLIDDLAQQVCAEICASLHRFDHSMGTFKNWVDSITLHTVLNYIKKQSKSLRPTSLDAVMEHGQEVSQDFVTHVSPELIALQNEKRKVLRTLMVRLQKKHPSYYQVLYLRSYCGMSVEEAAAELDWDSNAVYRNTNRALEKLKKWVAEVDNASDNVEIPRRGTK